jgi:hypothetical protein
MCYFSGCVCVGKHEYKGGKLCDQHYDLLMNTKIPDGDVVGRTPEEYIGELEPKEWDLVRDLKIRDGYKLCGVYNGDEV